MRIRGGDQMAIDAIVLRSVDNVATAVQNLKEAERGSMHLWCGSEKTHHDR